MMIGKIRLYPTSEPVAHILASYPVGSNTTVYYKEISNHTYESVLHPGIHSPLIISTITPTLFIIIGVIVCLLPYHNFMSSSPLVRYHNTHNE